MATIDMLLHGFTVGSDQGSFAFCGISLIRGTKNIVVDAAHVGRRELIRAKLAERGLTPADIDYVFLTHAHWDHSQNVDMFPNAKILLSPKEREYVKNPRESDWATPLWTSAMLERQPIQEVREGDEVDDGVTVIEIPGHSRGTQGLLLRQGGRVVAACGDALPNAWSAGHGLPRIVFWDVEEAKASIRKLLDRASAFYPGHDRPFAWQNGKPHYLEPTSMRIFGWPDIGEGEGPGGMVFDVGQPRETQIVGTGRGD
jgi:glyoxylase-like metal-dependent hydrolase (beta-lactamase superfamily II)